MYGGADFTGKATPRRERYVFTDENDRTQRRRNTSEFAAKGRSTYDTGFIRICKFSTDKSGLLQTREGVPMTNAPGGLHGVPLLLRVEEAARLCSYSRSFMYQRIALGEIPVIRRGRSVRIPATWLASWVDEEIAAWEQAQATPEERHRSGKSTKSSIPFGGSGGCGID